MAAPASAGREANLDGSIASARIAGPTENPYPIFDGPARGDRDQMVAGEILR